MFGVRVTGLISTMDASNSATTANYIDAPSPTDEQNAAKAKKKDRDSEISPTSKYNSPIAIIGVT